MKTTAPHSKSKPLRNRIPQKISAASIERLESRIAPAFVAALNGLVATLTGDASDEVLAISPNGALLMHNRFSAGDPGFVSDLDFDSTTPGEQTLATGAASTVIINLGAGNDTLTAGNGLSPLRVSGGPGNDILLGGDQADILSGGPGNDFIDGNRGNDTCIGGDGDDVFQWDPGDGSDKLDGSAGSDRLIFNGANIAEHLTYSAVGTRLLFTRDVANIVMDVGTVETVELNAQGGADVIAVNDLSSTDVRHLTIHLGTIGTTTPDGQLDTLSIIGSSLDDDIRVRSTENAIEVVGVAAAVRVDGFDATDTLNVLGGTGIDNVVATKSASTKLVITTDGEFENTALPGFHLSTPAGYDTGKSPSAVASGNLFGLGRDLVVANTKDNSLSVLFNSGNGTFLPAVQLSTGGVAPKSVVLEDFNNDGALDIAVTNSGSANVAVLLNNNDGTFATPALFATGQKPGILHVADLNGDGNPDLVMITAGNKLSVLPGDGTGGFGAATTIATRGLNPVDFAFADFNSDGHLDLAILHADSNNVVILTANADLTFGAPLKLAAGATPTALAVGDFNGDGRPDLAVTHAVNHFVNILFNASASSVTAFSARLKLTHAGNHATAALAVADLDQDGRDDLILGNSASGSVSVLLNAGAAVFRPVLRVDLDNTPLRKTSALAIADFNNDGRLDIAAANAGTADLSLLFSVPF